MKRKKVRRRSVVCVMLVILVGLVAGLAFWQRNNIKAVQEFTAYTQQELEEQLKQNDQQIKDTVATIPEITVREVTEEERQALRDGTMTQEELVDRLLGMEPKDTFQPETVEPETPEDKTEETAASSPSGDTNQQPQPPVSKPEEQEPAQSMTGAGEPTAPEPVVQPEQQKPAVSDYRDELSALIAKVYVLREEYLIALDNLQAEATADYRAMPKESRTGAQLADFVSKYLARGTALEKECDRKMDAIVQEMETLIKKNNGNLSLVDTVISTYANEKSLKKAWYMSELEKKGLI